jgi:hypothetical protein
MVSLNAKKKVFLVFVVVSVFLFLTVPANAATVLFEVGSTLFKSAAWGRSIDTNIHRISEEYTPLADQILCTVKHEATYYRAIDDLVLNIYRGGLAPEAGTFLATKSIPGPSLPPIGYATFDLDSCLELKSDVKYFFVFTRTEPTPSSGYLSKYRNGDEFPNSYFWRYEGSAFFGGAGWKRYSNLEWSLRLEGPDSKEPVIIVPGIMGSRLNRVSDGEEVWPNIGEMIRLNNGQDAYLNELQLDSSGQELPSQIMDSPEVVEEELVLGFNQVVYGNLINYFRNQGS